MNDQIQTAVARFAALIEKQQLQVVTAESCTGGGIAQAMTSKAGSSAWFERGFVCYSNAAKQEQLGVGADVLAAHGAVSEATALAMAKGAVQRSRAHISVAVTGIAGPDGGTEEKPVGTVWIAWGQKLGYAEARCFRFSGDRAAVREQTIVQAIQGLCERLK